MRALAHDGLGGRGRGRGVDERPQAALPERLPVADGVVARERVARGRDHGGPPAEQEIRSIEDRSTNYWLLEYLSRHKREQLLPAVALDAKGGIELEDYYLRAKVTATNKLQPGERVNVQIESIDPAKAEVRFRLV